MALTPKQEKYVQGLVAGLSQRKAYREAYPNSSSWKDATVDNKASAMLREDEILARYNVLINEYKQQSIWTRERATEELFWLLEKAKQDLGEEGFRQANSAALLNAIKELNEIALVYPLKAKQVEKLQSDMTKGDSQEDKLSQYFDMLGDAIE
ncbi:terminase [Jeotgalibaca porci]|uniref:Terminase n=1 Tax=Jeotgalibaca porci TaxID=1868793 RepID=A0A6G7WEE0_9LACT|nr:terminase [Jeotgalibaca porci]QIK50612.1 terminase [Jeotgalibaca porci]